MKLDAGKIKETAVKLFTGEITVQKRELWMAGAICLLLGIVIGLIKAPLTHGVTIGSHNGNNSRFGEDTCECIGACDCDECDCEA